MFISKEKLKQLEDRISELEAKTTVVLFEEGFNEYLSPLGYWRPIKSQQLDINKAFNLLISAIDLKFEKGETKTTSDRLVKKESPDKIIKKKRGQ